MGSPSTCSIFVKVGAIRSGVELVFPMPSLSTPTASQHASAAQRRPSANKKTNGLPTRPATRHIATLPRPHATHTAPHHAGSPTNSLVERSSINAHSIRPIELLYGTPYCTPHLSPRIIVRNVFFTTTMSTYRRRCLPINDVGGLILCSMSYSNHRRKGHGIRTFPFDP